MISRTSEILQFNMKYRVDVAYTITYCAIDSFFERGGDVESTIYIDVT